MLIFMYLKYKIKSKIAFNRHRTESTWWTALIELSVLSSKLCVLSFIQFLREPLTSEDSKHFFIWIKLSFI